MKHTAIFFLQTQVACLGGGVKTLAFHEYFQSTGCMPWWWGYRDTESHISHYSSNSQPKRTRIIYLNPTDTLHLTLEAPLQRRSLKNDSP